MRLVITEKPSVAKSISGVIGAWRRYDGYLEGSGYIVFWCVGHLVALAEPHLYEELYQKWRMEDLPIVPADWKYQVSEGTKKQFYVLKKLMDRSDVEEKKTSVMERLQEKKKEAKAAEETDRRCLRRRRIGMGS